MSKRLLLPHCLKADLRKVFTGVGLWVAILIIPYSILQPITHDIHALPSVVDTLDLSTRIGAMRALECVGYAIIASTLFLSEKTSQYVRFVLLRSGRWRYIASKLLACTISAILVACAGFGVFTLYLRIRGLSFFPQDLELLEELRVCGKNLLYSNQRGLFVALLAFCFSINAVCWSLWSLAVSAHTENIYAVVLSPLILSYLFNFILVDTLHMQTEGWNIDLHYLARGVTNISDAGSAIALTLSCFLPLIFLAALVYVLGMKGRLKNV